MEHIDRTGSLDFDLCQAHSIIERVKTDRIYAQNLYAALCNTVWQYQDPWYILQDRSWSCSWRHAGAIVADIRGSGDYMEWYCSGMMTGHPDDDLGTADYKICRGYRREGDVSDDVRDDLMKIGWYLFASGA